MPQRENLNLNEFYGFSDKLKNQLDHKLSDLQFSQVTNGLDDIHDALNAQQKISKNAPAKISSQYNPDDEFVPKFYSKLQ